MRKLLFLIPAFFFLILVLKSGQSLSSFEWWQSQNYDRLILPFSALVKKIKLKIMLLNIMHEALHGILKQTSRECLFCPATHKTVCHVVFSYAEKIRGQRENAVSRGIQSAFHPWFIYSEKFILVKTIIIILLIATLDPSKLVEYFLVSKMFPHLISSDKKDQ